MTDRPGLFQELKRRKVVRAAVVYAATAFVVLQVADIILPGLGVPAWGMSLVVVLTLLGLPDDWSDHPAVQAALDRPGLNELFEIRRRNLAAWREQGGS